MTDDAPPPPTDPSRHDRLGRSHQLRVDISIVLSLLPAWLKRALLDRNDDKARGARGEVVERLASSIEKRFRITWPGSDDERGDALPMATSAPLFGGPVPSMSPATETAESVDSCSPESEHKANR